MHKIVNGIKIDLTESEERSLLEEWSIESNKSNYMVDRQLHYPSIHDQLDIIYHDGLEEWKKVIKAVKDRYPKPQ